MTSIMKTSEIHESMGVLLKEETLQTVEHYVLQNTMVLESIEPFPGYNGENPFGESKPDSLFLITDKTYPVEHIFRTSQHICCLQNISLDACPSDVFIMNSNLPGIRIRGLHNYPLITEIQGCYLDRGIRFMKMKMINAPGVMSITKVFSFEKIATHIYKDLDDENTFYLTVPYHFSWNLFKRVTLNVKNNLDNSNFDAASGFLYLKDMMEFVRIYARNPELVRLETIREKYLDEIYKIRDDVL